MDFLKVAFQFLGKSSPIFVIAWLVMLFSLEGIFAVWGSREPTRYEHVGFALLTLFIAVIAAALWSVFTRKKKEETKKDGTDKAESEDRESEGCENEAGKNEEEDH